MKILKVDQEKPEKDIILEAVKFLRQGKILIHPTETCYGFAVDIFNQSALNLLYQAKNMPNSKPVSMMVRNLEEAKKYAEFDSSALRLAGEFWPGPLTLVLPRKKSLPSFFNEGHNTVGIRCPDSLLVQKLLEDFDGPLSTTSANLSGQPEAYNVDDFLLQIQGRSHVESGDIAV